MGIKEDFFNELKKKYAEEQIKRYFSLIKYIYIGQNIRNEGILQSDENLKNNKETIDFFLSDGIVDKRKWYRLDLFLLSNLGIQIGEILIKEEIEQKKETIKKELEKYPQLFVEFLINQYVSDSLAFDMERIYVFNWRELVLTDERIKKHIRNFFGLLKENELSVITNDYVSTRGGEERGKKYVIPSELRKFLQILYPTDGLSNEDIIDCKAAYILFDKIRYLEKGRTCFIKEEALSREDSSDSINIVIKNELDKYLSKGLIDNVLYSGEGIISFNIVKKDELLQENSLLYNEKIEKLLEPTEITSEKKSEKELTPEESVEHNKNIVSKLIKNKVRLYRLIAQLSHGKSMFNSYPTTELLGLNLINTIHYEKELGDFIIDLHQLVIESSANKILRFIGNKKGYWDSENEENNEISPKEFVEIKEEAGEDEKNKLYEDARETLNNIHNLRNHYSHLQDAERFYESSMIFKKLINISFPTTTEEISKTQTILLKKTSNALDNLCEVFTNVLCKRKY